MSNNNGIKIPLAIDTGMFVAGLIVAVTMWTNQKTMAEDIKEIKETPVTEARVVRIESELQHIKEKLDDQDEKLDKIIDKLESDDE